jgi:hypothetical protein
MVFEWSHPGVVLPQCLDVTPKFLLATASIGGVLAWGVYQAANKYPVCLALQLWTAALAFTYLLLVATLPVCLHFWCKRCNFFLKFLILVVIHGLVVLSLFTCFVGTCSSINVAMSVLKLCHKSFTFICFASSSNFFWFSAIPTKVVQKSPKVTAVIKIS